jgi:hypothetical protein
VVLLTTMNLALNRVHIHSLTVWSRWTTTVTHTSVLMSSHPTKDKGPKYAQVHCFVIGLHCSHHQYMYV